MAKTKNHSVRFDKERLTRLQKKYPDITTGQKAVDFLMDYWINRQDNQQSESDESKSNRPAIFDLLPESMRRKLEKI